MGIANWTLFIQERLRAYQSDVSLDQGSPATVQVIDPIVARLTPDPIETNLSIFIMTRLQQEHPMLYAREGSTIMDLLVKPNLVLLEPFRREIISIRNQLSLLYPEQLSSDEADALMANFFLTREMGDYARVRVRIYFRNPVSVNISSANVAFNAQGLRFVPTNAQSITAEGMLTNWDGNLYYFDVNYIAEREGTAYNVAADEIIGVTGLQSAVRATNLSRANPGSNEETTSEFIARGERSLGERSLNTVNGVVWALFDQFPTLTILQVIGFNDEEMGRDVLKGNSLGDVLDDGFGNNGSSTDDGDADGYTWVFSSATGNFTVLLGPVGTDISSYNLTVWIDPGTGVYRPYDFKLEEVLGATAITIDSSLTGSARLPDSLSSAFWCIRKRGDITLSDIPGGILFPSTTGGNVEVPADTVHIGGCTDFYIRGGETEEASLSLELLSDQLTVARREQATTVSGSPVVVLNDLTALEFSRIEEGKSSLYIEQGSDEGSYKIIQLYPIGPPYSVRLPSALTANASNLSYTIVDDVDVDLVEPKEIRYEGEDLRTIAGQYVIDTVSGSPDFNSVGVVDSDYVEILEGEDEGVYQIDTAGVSATQITLKSAMSTTQSPLSYRIYKAQTGIDLPLLRVKSVERLDSSLEPTGEIIPYRHPVDIQSRSFQNPGRVAKAGTSIDVTEGSYLRATSGSDTVSAVDLAGSVMSGINFWELGVRPGDIINVNSSDNQGYYTVQAVGTNGGLSFDYQIQVTADFRWSTIAGSDMMYEIGPPSYGSFRLYFLDPCSFEAAYGSAVFSVTVGNASYNFRPDPEVYSEYLPTSVTIPTAIFAPASNVIEPYTTDGSGTVDLKQHGLQMGDRVEITYAPLVGSADFDATPTVDVDGKYIKIDVGFGTETISLTGTAVGIDELVSQINSQLTIEVAARYDEDAPGTGKFVMLRGDRPISIISDGYANDCTDLVFGGNQKKWQDWLILNDPFKSSTPGVNKITENDSPEKGMYLVTSLNSYPLGGVEISNTDGSAWAGVYTINANNLGHFIRIAKPGVQKISSTEMNSQMDSLGFYYFDVECIGEGYGEPWNIDAELQATVSGYESEGWSITVENENLSYSMSERAWIDVSPRILVVGNDSDETNKIELVGGNIQVTYERDPMVEDVQTYVSDAQTRVICQSPLARSLFPKYIRTSITYRGGDQERDIRSAIAEYVEAVLPEQLLEISDITKIITDTGSGYVQQPIVVVGIGHNADRSITVERGEDIISLGRLSALLPDDDGTTVEGASYIQLDRII